MVFRGYASMMRSKVFNGIIRRTLPMSTTTNSTCPITGAISSKNIPSSPIDGGLPRPYSDIPGPTIYPLVGSIIDFSNTGSNTSDSNTAYYYKYGAITKQNITGDEIIICDPREHIKVFRAEGKYPKAMASDFWPFVKFAKSFKCSDLLLDGEKWKEVRMKLQPDILSPQAAASYLPSLIKIGIQASEVFPRSASDPHEFTCRVSFDMFSSSMLGKSRGMLSPETAAKEDHEFIDNSIQCMRSAGALVYSPYETFIEKYHVTDLYKKFEKTTIDVHKRSFELVQEALKEDLRRTEAQEHSADASYLGNLLRSGLLGRDAAGFEVSNLLLAAVDTTANYMNWLILNLARNPEKQRILAEELKNVLQGGDFSKEVQLPYLQACYRETHRLTPVQASVYRRLDEDIVLEGYLIPKGTKLSMNTEAIQKDPKYVDSPEEFLPERWLAPAVGARVGTPSEILDHKLLSAPFSFGSRMCLGSRLAELEIKVLIARIVQDWEFTMAEDSPKVGKREFLFLQPFPEPKFSVKEREISN